MKATQYTCGTCVPYTKVVEIFFSDYRGPEVAPAFWQMGILFTLGVLGMLGAVYATTVALTQPIAWVGVLATVTVLGEAVDNWLHYRRRVPIWFFRHRDADGRLIDHWHLEAPPKVNSGQWGGYYIADFHCFEARRVHQQAIGDERIDLSEFLVFGPIAKFVANGKNHKLIDPSSISWDGEINFQRVKDWRIRKVSSKYNGSDTANLFIDLGDTWRGKMADLSPDKFWGLISRASNTADLARCINGLEHDRAGLARGVKTQKQTSHLLTKAMVETITELGQLDTENKSCCQTCVAIRGDLTVAIQAAGALPDIDPKIKQLAEEQAKLTRLPAMK